MNKKPFQFRTVEEWKASLATLPDNSFFELMRSVLGNIKTPFSKQKLLDDLYAFLIREDIRGIIRDYIDEGDRRIIAAVALLEEPVQAEMESFFAGDIPFAVLHGRLLNLEERLILFRVKVDGKSRLTLNPVLESVLAPYTGDINLLFPSTLTDAEAAPRPQSMTIAGNGRMLACLYAFLCGAGGLFLSEGGLRKKAMERWGRLFPGTDAEQVLALMQTLRLAAAGREGIAGDEEYLRDFAYLPSRERGEYWASAMMLARHGIKEEGEDAYLFRADLRNIAAFLHRFLDMLERKRSYPEVTLTRLAALVFKESRFMSLNESILEGMVRILEEAGVLTPASLGHWRVASLDPQIPEETPRIALDSPFSLLLFPEISCEDALSLAFFCSLPEDPEPVETLVRFEITRESAVRGFDLGLTAKDMCAMLERLAGETPDSSLEWSLQDWEKRRSQAGLYEGLVLTLAEESRYLAAAGPLSMMIKQTLAPGVYLLGRERDEDPYQARKSALAALEKAGAPIVAVPRCIMGPLSDSGRLWRRTLFSRLGSGWFLPGASSGTAGGEAAPEQSPPEGASEEQAAEREAGAEKRRKELLAGFRAALDKMSSFKPLPKNEREELAARIERRMVLSEAQLVGASLKYERLEAKGLDYAGKALIAKQAIAAGALLEISFPDPSGKTVVRLGLPQGLEKKAGDSLLVFKPGDGEVFKIAIGKISLLRRVKQSIFGE